MKTRIKKCMLLFFRFLPLKEELILESHPDFSDSAAVFYEYLLSRGVNKKIRIHWALHEDTEEPENLPENTDTFRLKSGNWKDICRRLNILYRSRYILDSNSYIKKRRKGQVRIHLGHGMPVKITHGYHGAEFLGETDGYLTAGTCWEKVFAEKLGIRKEVLLPFGLPRNDLLFSEGWKGGASAGLSDSREEPIRFILWMPTYRQHKSDRTAHMEKSFPFGLPLIETGEQLAELDRILTETGQYLYYRPHPVQDLSEFRKKEWQRIRLADDAFLKREGIHLYQLIAGAEALITDYSSVYFDYLLTNSPVALTWCDREEYFSKYDCAFDSMEDEMKGEHLDSFEDIRQFVCNISENAAAPAYIPELRDRFFDHADAQACSRLFRHLAERYHFAE